MMFGCLGRPGKTRKYSLLDDEKSYGTFSSGAGSSKVDSTDRLRRLREEISTAGIDVYIIPAGDAHGSEVVADKDRRQRYISGFTGEASTILVTRSDAVLFVDGRYHIQAVDEVDVNWKVQKVGLPGVKTWLEYVKALPSSIKVGIDYNLFDISSVRSLLNILQEADQSSTRLIQCPHNLVDAIWSDRPAGSSVALTLHEQYAGRSSKDKLSALREFIRSNNANAFIVHELSELAWLLNLRGADIPYSPVFEGYALVTLEAVEIFLDKRKIDSKVAKYLSDLKIHVHPYTQFGEHVLRFLKECPTVNDSPACCRVLISHTASYYIYQLLQTEQGKSCAIHVDSPIELAKSIKNVTELSGIRAGYLRDAVAWVQWMAWLEEKMSDGYDAAFTEWHAAAKLTDLRRHQPLFQGLAYGDISATGPNAALPHYATHKDTSAPIDLTTPYLNDSGAQYLDCTIDTTRTYHFGKPTAEQKHAYTRVLQGHIRAAMQTFPEGTAGSALDALARQPMWADGFNYLHGTGHGVGSYLNVHEGPHRIAGFSQVPLRVGQIVSIEPGWYAANNFGIRIESIYLVKETETRYQFGGNWFGFERITQVPHDLKMINWKMLSKDEYDWLKRTNKECVAAVQPYIPPADKRTHRWLKRQLL